MLHNLLIDGFNELSIPFTQAQLQLFSDFYHLYKENAEKINISTLTTENDFAIKHVLDSAAAYTFMKNSKSLLDIGSGGGFPGVILAILCPSTSITLVDVIAKKVNYLNSIIKELTLPNCIAYNATLSKVLGSFDTITFRAVGTLEKIMNIAKPYFKKDTRVIAYKGKIETINEEVSLLKKNLNVSIHPLLVPFLDASRNLVIIKDKK